MSIGGFFYFCGVALTNFIGREQEGTVALHNAIHRMAKKYGVHL